MVLAIWNADVNANIMKWVYLFVCLFTMSVRYENFIKVWIFELTFDGFFEVSQRFVLGKNIANQEINQ